MQKYIKHLNIFEKLIALTKKFPRKEKIKC
jgi:hypothetical protein